MGHPVILGTLEYLEAIRRSKTKKSDTNVEASGDTENFDEFLSDSNDSEEYHEFVEETQVESFETLLDVEDKGNFLNVFLLFKDTLRCMNFFCKLTVFPKSSYHIFPTIDLNSVVFWTNVN